MLSGPQGFLLQQAGPWWPSHPRAAYPGPAGDSKGHADTHGTLPATGAGPRVAVQAMAIPCGLGAGLRTPSPGPSPGGRRRLASGSAGGAARGGGHASQPSERAEMPSHPETTWENLSTRSTFFFPHRIQFIVIICTFY